MSRNAVITEDQVGGDSYFTLTVGGSLERSLSRPCACNAVFRSVRTEFSVTLHKQRAAIMARDTVRRSHRWVKIVYFPLGFFASCELGLWGTIETLPILQKAAFEVDQDGFLYALSFLLPFILWPIYFGVCALACTWAFFYLRQSPRFLKIVTAIFAALSATFFCHIFS